MIIAFELLLYMKMKVILLLDCTIIRPSVLPVIISAGPILAETEKPKVLSNFFENRNRSEPTSVKHKEPNKNRNRNWEPRVTGSVEIEQNQANFLQNVAILD